MTQKIRSLLLGKKVTGLRDINYNESMLIVITHPDKCKNTMVYLLCVYMQT